MILVVDPINHAQFAQVLDDVTLIQTSLFGEDAMGQCAAAATPHVIARKALLPTYLVGLDQGGFVLSFAIFAQVAPNSRGHRPHPLPAHSGAALGQSVQFCFDGKGMGARGPADTTGAVELLIAAMEHAQRAGWQNLSAVIDLQISRILQQSGVIPPNHLPGRATLRNGVAVMATTWPCTPDGIAALRAYAGLSGEVFLSDSAAKAVLEARAMSQSLGQTPAALRPNDIATYCAQLLAAAQTEKERLAVHRLLDHLVKKGLHPMPRKTAVTPQQG